MDLAVWGRGDARGGRRGFRVAAVGRLGVWGRAGEERWGALGGGGIEAQGASARGEAILDTCFKLRGNQEFLKHALGINTRMSHVEQRWPINCFMRL